MTNREASTTDEEATDELARRVGRNVRALRETMGLDQPQVGELLGVTKALVWRIEHGRQNLTLRTLVRLSRVLSVPVEQLLDPSGPAGGTPAAAPPPG